MNDHIYITVASSGSAEPYSWLYLALGLLIGAYLILHVGIALIRDSKRPRYQLGQMADPDTDCGDLHSRNPASGAAGDDKAPPAAPAPDRGTRS